MTKKKSIVYTNQDTYGYQEFATWLQSQGYKLKYVTGPDYDSWFFEPYQGITAAFCEPNHGQSYGTMDGRLAADNERCFDKWSKCPLVMIIGPDTDRTKLLEHLKWLASEEGYNHSNSYAYLDNRILPMELGEDE